MIDLFYLFKSKDAAIHKTETKMRCIYENKKHNNN